MQTAAVMRAAPRPEGPKTASHKPEAPIERAGRLVSVLPIHHSGLGPMPFLRRASRIIEAFNRRERDPLTEHARIND